MGRLELKYLLKQSQIAAFCREIAPFVDLDKFSTIRPDKKYSVRSIYFDTPLLDFYRDKVIGLKKRKKIRIRGYNNYSENNITFLELKAKNGPIISKYRAAVLYKNLSALLQSQEIEKYVLNSNGFASGQEQAQVFLAEVLKLNLTPVIKIIYEREAYFYKFNRQVRITIDTNLRSCPTVGLETLYQEENTVYSLINQAILEIKVPTDIPSWLRQVIGRQDLQLQALSKYIICLEDNSNYQHRLQKSLRGLSRYHQFRDLTVIENMD